MARRENTFSLPNRRHRGWLWAWLACFVLVVAPTVSYLIASARGVQVVEVCSSFGVKRITLDAQGRPLDAPPDASHAPSHCSFCVASLDPCVPSPAALAPHGQFPVADAPPEPRSALFVTALPRRYQARAPPLPHPIS